MNGASDLMVAAFGDKGKHARTTVGVAALPPTRRWKSRACSKCPERCATALDWLTARPIAHRGLHDAAHGVIENTAGAVRAAIAAGYGIEIDLQISGDGEAMVHHDDVLGRLTEGEGRLDRLTRRRAQARSVPRQQRAHDDAWRTVRPRRRARHDAARAEKPLRRRRPPARAGRRGARRISRSGRADVVRSRCSSSCCGKSPSPAARDHCGKIPAASRIGIGCRRGMRYGMGYSAARP